MSTLYLVATPIGNLEDLSARALRILGQVGLIAAEDTRQTQKLLNHFNLHTRLISYHQHSQPSRLAEVLAALETGDVALVSDAGTPNLNDPGGELVRASLAGGHVVSPIPGPSAPLAALVASGLPTEAFLYLGYLPRKTIDRQRLLTSVADLPYTLIFLETPHRLLPALADLEASLGDRQAAVARELTKVHEEIWRGSLSAARQRFSAAPPRGEFTLVIAGAQPRAVEPWDEARLHAALRAGLAQGQAPAQLAAQLAADSGWPRRQVYRLLMQMQNL
jgi:16S rRNA (cytidine1402-2'-O)-methyltransferase